MPFAIPVSTPSSGGSGTSLAVWTKTSKTYTNFSVAAMTSKINLSSLPAKTIVKNILINVTTVFNDGSANAPIISAIGVTGNDALFFFVQDDNISILNTLGQYYYFSGGKSQIRSFVISEQASVYDYTGPIWGSLSGSSQMNITLTASVNFNTFNQGAFDIYVETDTLP